MTRPVGQGNSNMDGRIIFKCSGTVHRFNPNIREWNHLQGTDVSDFLITLAPMGERRHTLIAFSQRTNLPFLKINLGRGTSYTRDDRDASLNVLKVFSEFGTEIFGFKVLSKEEAVTFSFHLQQIINGMPGMPPYAQNQWQQNNNKGAFEGLAREQFSHPNFQALSPPNQNRIPGMPHQGIAQQRYEPMTMPPNRYMNEDYRIKPSFMHGLDEIDHYHEYKELEPDYRELEPEIYKQPRKENIYDVVDEESPHYQVSPIHKTSRQKVPSLEPQNTSNPVMGRRDSTTIKQEQFVLSNQQKETDAKPAENVKISPEKQASNQTAQTQETSEEQKPVMQNFENLAAKDEQVKPKENAETKSASKKDRETFDVSSLDISCDMLAEAIDLGNTEKAKEFASQLASEKVKLTIQMLCSEEEKRLHDSTINITVQVEDKQTTKPIIIKMNVDPSRTTIGKLKYMVLESYKFPVKVQRWVVGRRLPKDNQTLKSLDVTTTGTVVFLYLLSAKSAGITKNSLGNDETDAASKNEIELPPRDYPRTDRRTPPPPPHNPNFPQYHSVPNSNYPYNPPFRAWDGRPMNPGQEQHQLLQSLQGGISMPQQLPGFIPPYAERPYHQFQVPPQPPPGNTLQRPPPPPPNSTLQRPPPPPPPKRQGWICAQCTFVNKPTRPGCEMCGMDRPADYIPPTNLKIDEQEQLRLFQEEELERMAFELEEKTRKEERLAAIRNFQNTLQTAEMNLIPNPEKFECSICYDDVEVGEGAMLRECLHSFCRDCLVEHIKACEDPEVRCPFIDGDVTCNEVITTQEISALLPEMEFLKYLDKSINTAENKAANSFHCKTPNCKGWCIYEDAVNWFHCPICGQKNCLTCKAIHGDLSCKDYQDDLKRRSQNDEAARRTQQMLEDMVKKGDAMHCPQCDVILQKKDGCDWLRCSMCRTEICWVTRGPRWGPKGNGDTSGGCKCRINGKPCHPKCGNCH